jgi:hypothetical protein
MSMVGSYQEEKSLEAKEPASASFATIGAVYTDGVTLIFDGTETASTKHYKVNRTAAFAAGDRVKITRDSGTYIVEYPVGNPVSGVTPVYLRYYGGKIQAKAGADGTWVNLN